MSSVRTLVLLASAVMVLTAGFLGLPDTVRVQLAEVLQLLTAGPAHAHHQATAFHVCLPATFSSQE